MLVLEEKEVEVRRGQRVSPATKTTEFITLRNTPLSMNSRQTIPRVMPLLKLPLE